MFTKSHSKSQNWISPLYIILLLIIPQLIHKITRKFVFQVVPDPKRRCSRPKTQVFQTQNRGVPALFPSRSRGIPDFVPGLILLPSFAQAFSKGLILPIPFCLSFFQKLNLLEHFSKSLICSRTKNYTKTTPELHRI